MKHKFIRILVVLLVLSLPLFIWRMYLAHFVNQQLTEIRATGLPTNGKELNAYYRAVPDNQNAALVMTQAFELRRNYGDSRSNLIFNFKPPGRRELLTAEQVELLEGYIALNAAMVDKANQALVLPSSRYPVDFTLLMNTPLAHLGWLKQLAEIQRYSALLAIRAGRSESASSNVVTILALARTLDDEPCVISQRVRLKLIQTAFTTLEHRANAETFSAAELDRLAAAFARTGTTNLMVRALIGERAMTMPYFRMTRAEASRIRSPKNGAGSEENSPLPCYGPFLLRLIGYYELDFGSYLYAMNKGIALARRPPPDNRTADGYFAYVGEESMKRHRIISGGTLSYYSGVVSRENEGITHQRLVMTALAIEQFSNQNRQIPEKFDELVPLFLPAVPADPFDGEPLRYHRLANGYVIYSVGRDGEDNGGRERPTDAKSSDKTGYDITFTVER
jgi:hypothetical protein